MSDFITQLEAELDRARRGQSWVLLKATEGEAVIALVKAAHDVDLIHTTTMDPIPPSFAHLRAALEALDKGKK